MHNNILPPSDINLRFTTHEHCAAFKRLKAESEYQFQQAKTAADRRYWQHQIDRADCHLLRWQAKLAREEVSQ